MNKFKRIVIPTAAILGVITLALFSVSYADAQENGYYPPIVQKIAEKFDLNESDIQAVFDEERDERHAEMETRWVEKLDDLVNSGKITADQKQVIMDKHEDMQNKMLELRDLDPQERHEKMREIHDEFRSWAQGQGIDLPLVGPMGGGFGKGMHRGLGMGF